MGIAILLQQLYYLLLEVALHKYLAILGAAAHAASCLQHTAQLFKVVFSAHEVAHQGYSLASAVVLFNAHSQLLLLLGEGLIFLLFIGGIYKVGVCRIDNVEALFPVVALNIGSVVLGVYRRLSYNIFATNFKASQNIITFATL